MSIEIAASMFVATLGIGWLLRRSAKLMRGGWGYAFDAKKQTGRKFRWGGR